MFRLATFAALLVASFALVACTASDLSGEATLDRFDVKPCATPGFNKLYIARAL